MSSTRGSINALKAAMLAVGCVLEERALSSGLVDAVNQALIRDRSFIHGVVLSLGGGTVVNTDVEICVGEVSPNDHRVVIEADATSLTALYRTLSSPVSFLRQPEVLTEHCDGMCTGDFFTMHSTGTVFCSPTRQCAFISAGKGCLFCTYEPGRVVRLPEESFRRMLGRLLANVPGIDAIAIGGGTTSIRDGGIGYYSRLVAVAREAQLSTSLEVVPPQLLDRLSILQDAGLHSLIMSLEIWDEGIRRRVCPGKGQISKDHYMAAWSRAVRVFGAGNVASVLLVGIEPSEMTRRGMRALAQLGVVPTLIPYRVYPRSRLNAAPVSPDEYLSLESELSTVLAEQGLDPRKQPACGGCGGCCLGNELASMVGVIGDEPIAR